MLTPHLVIIANLQATCKTKNIKAQEKAGS